MSGALADGLRIAAETPDQPEVRALIDALDAYQRALYPAESNHLLDMAALLRPEVLFLVARDAASGAATGCGAVVLKARYGEVKRMIVSPASRGRGVARALLAALEAGAVERGCIELRLETGIHQPEALALYARCGFERCAPFGDYLDDPLSVFMRKPLVVAARGD